MLPFFQCISTHFQIVCYLLLYLQKLFISLSLSLQQFCRKALGDTSIHSRCLPWLAALKNQMFKIKAHLNSSPESSSTVLSSLQLLEHKLIQAAFISHFLELY